MYIYLLIYFYIFAPNIEINLYLQSNCNTNIVNYLYKNIIEMKKVSVLILQKILNENNFSIELAKILDIQQQSVLGLAKRNSNKLTLFIAVQFYKEKGFTEDEIFLQPKINSN